MPHLRMAALGFRVHTGWAAAVAASDCDVLERRRIACEPRQTRFLYHRAAEIPFQQAAKLIETGREETIAAAVREIADLLDALARNGTKIETACVPAGNSKLPEALADILAAHSRIHAAEGVFYREALATACAQQGLQVVRAPERDLQALAAAALACGGEELRARLVRLGKQLGPPWAEDQKLATLAAWSTHKSARPKAAGAVLGAARARR